MFKHGNHNGSKQKKSKGPSSAFLHDPQTVLENLPLKDGQVFADLGCGAGDYTVAASSMVGAKGQVYALDKEKSLVDHLTIRARKESLRNVTSLTADILSSLPFEDKSVDVVFITTVLHIFNLKKIASSLFPEIHRILKPGGVLAIVEVKKEDRNFGPPKEMCHSPEEIQAAVEPHSFILKARTFFDYTYLIQFNLVEEKI